MPVRRRVDLDFVRNFLETYYVTSVSFLSEYWTDAVDWGITAFVVMSKQAGLAGGRVLRRVHPDE